MKNQKKISIITFASAALLFTAGSALAANAPAAASLHDAQAEARLKQMSDYMGGLKSFSADTYVVDEQIMGDGFKLAALRSGSIKIKRPDKLYISRTGVIRDQEVFFDGKNLVIYGKNLKMALTVPVKGDMDAALGTAAETFGKDVQGRDLISSDLYSPLMEVITESANLGVVKIGDRNCRQLAFRTDEVDMQLWVAEGDKPLPCRYTITSKWTHAAPQYTVTFDNWQVNQKLQDSDFTFTAPDGVKKVTVEAFKNALMQEMNNAGGK
ncbi:MAG: DUF2092 domain-containing protein [Thermodesulfobacteriota bacterium]|nr:DUF2092 domain-containing protein [Thermodesulfobacteriota bacterium]